LATLLRKSRLFFVCVRESWRGAHAVLVQSCVGAGHPFGKLGAEIDRSIERSVMDRESVLIGVLVHTLCGLTDTHRERKAY